MWLYPGPLVSSNKTDHHDITEILKDALNTIKQTNKTVSSRPRLSGITTHNVSGDRHRLHK